jgi:hypothetical protein
MMTTLALSDGWTLGMFVIQTIAMVVWALTMLWVKNSIGKINTLEAEVKKQATDMVDAKILTFVTEFKSTVKHLETLIQQQERRLARGDEDFDRLRDHDQASDAKVLLAISGLKDWMHQQFASKEDMKRIEGQFDRLPCKECQR